MEPGYNVVIESHPTASLPPLEVLKPTRQPATYFPASDLPPAEPPCCPPSTSKKVPVELDVAGAAEVLACAFGTGVIIGAMIMYAFSSRPVVLAEL